MGLINLFFFFSIYASKGFLGLLALRISVYIRILTPNKKGLQGATRIIRISLRKRKTKDIKSYLLTMLLKVIFTILPNFRQFFINVQKYYMGWFLRRLTNLKRIGKDNQILGVFIPSKEL